MATAVHFGAGNIGRGFIAQLLHESGYEVIFVDIIDDLVNSINASKSYKIIEVGEAVKSKVITNYRAINSKYNIDEAVKCIADADIVTCAVGPSTLKSVAKPIADGLAARTKSKPLAIIACENMINATDALKALIIAEMEPEALKDLPFKAEFGNCVVDRIVPTQPLYANLDIFTESFYNWCVEITGFTSGGHPEIQGVHWVKRLNPYVERKLYTLNTGHATAAYFAYHKGIKTIYEAMTDPEIRKQVQEVLEETTYLFRDKYGITPEDQQLYIDTIMSRISNRHLKDLAVRVGRAPLRKLSRNERFIGPAAQIAERGCYDVTALARGVEMALRFQNVEGDKESKELAHIMSTLGPEEATTRITGLQPTHPLYPTIIDKVKLVQDDRT